MSSRAMTWTTQRTRPTVERKSSKTRPAPIQLQTENGFAIVRRCDLDGRDSAKGTQHCFVVRDPYQYELDITVGFSQAGIAEAINRSYGRLTLDSSFWLNCAEHHLADYLWENDDYPPDAQITIDCLTPADIELAQRWEEETPVERSTRVARIKAGHTSNNGDGLPKSKTQTVRLLTENGYFIERVSDDDELANDSPQHCHFRVTDPKGLQRAIVVSFADPLITEIQKRRRRPELAASSKCWLVIAEKYLADHLWREGLPPNGGLIIDELSSDDLLLAAHWQEHE